MTTRSALLATLLLAPAIGHADTPTAKPSSDAADAGKRFSAGVMLYNEADYSAALVEFKRAYVIAPNSTVLYNIGQTHFQLQDYAAAYLALTQYLAEAGPTAPHAEEVRATIEVLRGRTAKLAVTSTVVGATVTVDDQVVGKTPLVEPVLVSIGRRRVVLALEGRTLDTRTVDVAAGDTVRVELQAPAATATATTGPADVDGRPVAHERSTLVPTLWVTTGVLAAGALVMGGLAWKASNDLDDLRGQFPVTRDALAKKSDRVALYSNVGDGLAVAGVAVGVVALVLSLRHHTDHESSTRVSIGARGIGVMGSF